jgi:uncharacterized Zn-binding protein involved in type VI secretion
MSKRYYIHVGDKTTTGGVVITGLSTITWHDHICSFDGDKIQCPACKSIGTIKIAGTRISHTGSHDKEMALDGDLCICKCKPPPRLIASQSIYMTEGVPTAFNLKSWSYDERFILKDTDDVVLVNMPYTIKLENSKLIHGETDEYGQTSRYFTENPSEISVHIGHIEKLEDL